MKKILGIVGILIIFSIFIAGAFKYGYLAGLKGQIEVDSVPTSVNPTEGSNISSPMASKIVTRSSVETTLVLRGKLIKVSADRSVVIGGTSGDTLTVYFRESATMHVPFPGTPGEPPRLDMTKLPEFLGQDVTIIAFFGKSQILEGTTFFPKDLDIRL